VTLLVRTLAPSEHLAYLAARTEQGRSVSFLQAPSWAGVKAEWGHESVGWTTPDGEVVGAGLVLYRQVPRLKRYLAYLPEGPDIDWLGERPTRSDGRPHDLADWLRPLLDHLRAEGAFTVKMGPRVIMREWGPETLKTAIATGSVRRLRDVGPDVLDDRALALVERLRELGWRQRPDTGAGFGDVQPRYVFQVPLAGRSADDLFTGFNQLWRRNVRKAEKAGVEVSVGTADDLPEFHRVYVETAARDRFTPRGLAYFQRMFAAMTAEDPDRIRLYLARHEGEVVAATTWVRVGDHVWYSYGASTSASREVRPSNAIQWRMMTDALDAGASVYDMRGIADTLDPDDHLFGLLQFKLGTGGRACEYVGEWDFPLRPLMAKAFETYLARK